MPNYHIIDVNKIGIIAENYIITRPDKVRISYEEDGSMQIRLYGVIYKMDFRNPFPQIKLENPTKKGYVITSDGLIEWFNILTIVKTENIYFVIPSQYNYIGQTFSQNNKYFTEITCIDYVCKEEPQKIIKLTEKDLFIYEEDKNYVAISSFSHAKVNAQKEFLIIEYDRDVGLIYVKIDDNFYATPIYLKGGLYSGLFNKLVIPYGTCFKIVDIEQKQTYYACLEPG